MLSGPCRFSHRISCTTSDQRWNELDRGPALGCGPIEHYHESLSCSWFNMTAPSWRWTNRLVFYRIRDLAKTSQQETKISVATPSFVACCRATPPSFSFGILQYRLTAHEVHPTLVRSSDSNTWAWKAGCKATRGWAREMESKRREVTREVMSYFGWYKREL